MPLLGPVHVYLLSVTQSRLHVYQQYMSRSSCIPASTVLAIPPSAANEDLTAIGQLPVRWAWAQSQVLSVGDQRAIAGRITCVTNPADGASGPEIGGPPKEGGGFHTPTPFVSLSAGVCRQASKTWSEAKLA